MRRCWCAVLVSLLWVGVSTAQELVWVGAGAGGTWEFNSPVSPGTNLTRHSGASPAVFVALPITDDTLFRVRAAELEHPVQFVNTTLDGSIRAYTVGVDYFMQGVFGKASFSGGVGAYQQVLETSGYKELAVTKVGWYVGIGEWFELTRRTRIVAEVTYHRSDHFDKPNLLTPTVSFAVSF
jgi:hypothetical protein